MVLLDSSCRKRNKLKISYWLITNWLCVMARCERALGFSISSVSDTVVMLRCFFFGLSIHLWRSRFYFWTQLTIDKRSPSLVDKAKCSETRHFAFQSPDCKVRQEGVYCHLDWGPHASIFVSDSWSHVSGRKRIRHVAILRPSYRLRVRPWFIYFSHSIADVVTLDFVVILMWFRSEFAATVIGASGFFYDAYVR